MFERVGRIPNPADRSAALSTAMALSASVYAFADFIGLEVSPPEESRREPLLDESGKVALTQGKCFLRG